MIETDPGSKYVYRNRWTAILSDGTRVFEDRIPNKPSAWLRLKEHLEKTDLTLIGFELFSDDVDLIMPRKVDGYFQSKKLIHDSRSGQENHYPGIGYVLGDTIFISWILENRNILKEERRLNKNDPAVIFC